MLCEVLICACVISRPIIYDVRWYLLKERRRKTVHIITVQDTALGTFRLPIVVQTVYGYASMCVPVYTCVDKADGKGGVQGSLDDA